MMVSKDFHLYTIEHKVHQKYLYPNLFLLELFGLCILIGEFNFLSKFIIFMYKISLRTIIFKGNFIIR